MTRVTPTRSDYRTRAELDRAGLRSRDRFAREPQIAPIVQRDAQIGEPVDVIPSGEVAPEVVSPAFSPAEG